MWDACACDRRVHVKSVCMLQAMARRSSVCVTLACTQRLCAVWNVCMKDIRPCGVAIADHGRGRRANLLESFVEKESRVPDYSSHGATRPVPPSPNGPFKYKHTLLFLLLLLLLLLFSTSPCSLPLDPANLNLCSLSFFCEEIVWYTFQTFM